MLNGGHKYRVVAIVVSSNSEKHLSLSSQSHVSPQIVTSKFGIGGRKDDRTFAHPIFIHSISQILLHTFGYLPGSSLDVLVSFGKNHKIVGFGRKIFRDLLHNFLVLRRGAMARVNQMKNDSEVGSFFKILTHKLGPLISLLLWYFGKAESRQISNQERIGVGFTNHFVAKSDFFFTPGDVIDGEEIKLLCLTRRFAGVCKGFAIGDLNPDRKIFVKK